MSLPRTRAVTRKCSDCGGSFVFLKPGEKCAKCLEKAGNPQAERIAWLENQLYTMLSNFEDQMIEGQDIVSESIGLEKENAKLKAEIKELKEGLPIEKAKTGEDFIVTMKSLDGIKSYIAAYQTRGLVRHWITDDGDALYEPKILRVDHLPSQNSQTQEGS